MFAHDSQSNEPCSKLSERVDVDGYDLSGVSARHRWTILIESLCPQNQKRLLEEGVTAPEGHLLSRHEEIEAEATNRACVLAHQVTVRFAER